MNQVMPFASPHPEEAGGLRVFFVPSRTTIERFEVLELAEGSVVDKEHRQLVVDVRWRPSIPAGKSIVLSIDVEGEPLVAAQAFWRAAEGAFLPVPDVAADISPVLAAAGGPLDDYRTFASAMFMTKCDSVRKHPNHRVRRYGSFFCDMDLNTNRSLLHLSGMSVQQSGEISTTVFLIEPLVLARMHERRKGQPLSQLSHPLERSDISRISTLLLTIYRENLNVGDSRIDLEELWTAFEMFANGELRVAETLKFPWNCEPNGAALFCFAEFGFLAVELGIDVDEWTAILPNHVAIQKIFAVAYTPDEGKLRFRNYLPGNWSATKKVGPQFKARQRVRFWDMSLNDLEAAAGENLREALADEP